MNGLKEKNGPNYANLLSNIPFLELEYPKVDNRTTSQGKGSDAIDAFLLRFLRAGDGNCDVASAILINYILFYL